LTVLLGKEETRKEKEKGKGKRKRGVGGVGKIIPPLSAVHE